MSERISINTEEMEWEDAEGYPAGVKWKVLWRDDETDALTVLLKFPEGTGHEAHTHPCNQESYVLKGRRTGHYGRTPKNVEHGEVTFPEETILLHWWDGPR